MLSCARRYDKITNSSLREHYMKTVVDHTFPFERSTQQRLQQGVQSIVPLYADLATGGDIDLALKQLKAHLREHVVWERNTVWREMIGLERRGWGTVGRARHNGSDADIGGTGVDLPLVQPASPPTGLLEGKRRRSRYGLPSWINSQTLAGAIAIMLFLFILSGSWFDRIEEQNCLALLAVVIIFWALEVSNSSSPRCCRDLRANRVCGHVIADHAPLRHGTHGPALGRRLARVAFDGRRGPPAHVARGDQVHLFANVFADHHVAARRFHARGGSVKAEHRQGALSQPVYPLSPSNQR